MKKLAVILLLAGPALATDYTVSLPPAHDPILERARIRANEQVCAAVGLPTSCTRAQAIAVDPVRGADYSNTILAFVTKRVKDVVATEKATSDAEDVTAFEQLWAIASQALRDSVCAQLGGQPGCKP